MGKEKVSLAEKETPNIDESDNSDAVISDSILEGDDNFDDDDDDDDDDWDLTDSFHEQERGAELSQIEAFLNQTLMVRCERYNANLTSVSCRRKKESPPPRLKNATISEEENMQNHPCFACVGPIIVNWNIDESPIALHEVEKRRVIVHPGLEDDFTAARAKQIELYKENAKHLVKYPGLELVEAGEAGSPPPIVIESDEERPRRGRKAAKPTAKAPSAPAPAANQKSSGDESAGKATSSAKAATIEAKETPNESSAATEEKKTKSSKKAAKDDSKKAESAKKKESSKPTKKAKKAEADTKKVEKAEKTEKPKAKAKKTKAKATKSKGAKSAEDHAPCTNCGREYSAKHWRGELCNPCYAKKLRERKKKQKPKTETTTAKKTKEAHPPCTSCGRDYSPKHWRGEICNPCYAKKLRERKKREKAKK